MFSHYFLSLISLILIIAGHVAKASSTETACTEFHEYHGSFHYQRLVSSEGICFLSIDPSDVGDFVYRSYLATSEGMFMIFNSYNGSENSDSTGARIFHFFPRNQIPTIEERPEGILLNLANVSLKILFSTTETKILSAQGTQISEETAVTKSNFGGIEFKNTQALILDSGFGIGSDVTAETSRSSKFYDTFGGSCSVKNSEIFDISSSGDSKFKFSDQDLKIFLSKRCPNLKVNF